MLARTSVSRHACGLSVRMAAASLSPFQPLSLVSESKKNVVYSSKVRTSAVQTRLFHSSKSMSSSFLDGYNEHVAERLTVGPGIAPKPLDAAQVAELIAEVKVRKTKNFSSLSD